MKARVALVVAVGIITMSLAASPLAQDPQDNGVRTSISVAVSTFVLPSQSEFSGSDVHVEEGNAVLDGTVPLTVVTNDFDWCLEIELAAEAKVPDGTEITFRLLSADAKTVLRESSMKGQRVRILGTGETGYFDLLLNVRGVWSDTVDVGVFKLVLDFSGGRSDSEGKRIMQE